MNKTYIARYCLITEDGGLQVVEFQEADFVLAARTAVSRCPQFYKLYSLEEEPARLKPPPDTSWVKMDNVRETDLSAARSNARRKYRDRGGH